MYAVGIDVSKEKSTISIITTEGEVIEKPFEINHDQEGFDILLSKIKNYKKEEIKFLMEATGHYHLPLLNALIEKNYFVCVENALVIKKYFDIDLRKVKNDKKDSLKLACYCSEKWFKLRKFEVTDEIREQLQFLSRQYNQYIKIKINLKIQLTNMIDKTFPGIKSIVDDENRYELLLDIYEKYSYPSLVLKKSKIKFINEIDNMAKKYRHKVGKTIGENIYAKAPTIITSCPYNESLQLSINSCILLLRNIIKVTNDIISKMDELAKQLKEFDVVNQMKGVGPKTRARLIAEIGDVRRFKNANCLIAFCGIDAPPYQSGNFNSTNRHISKRGNKYLRKVGYEVTKSIKSSRPKTDNSVYLFMIRKEAEGKNKTLVKIAGLNKFLRIYYARVKELYTWLIFGVRGSLPIFC